MLGPFHIVTKSSEAPEERKQSEHWSLDPYELCDWRGKNHQLLVSVEKEAESGQVGVLLVWELLLLQILRHNRLHLQQEATKKTLKAQIEYVFMMI